MTDSQNTRDQITSEKSPNARDQIAFCAFHSFSVEVQTNAGYIHETPCIIATCRLGLWVDLLQVDLLASGASLVWLRSGRPRATKSREVDLSRLMGFHLHFAPKMGIAVTRIWGFRFHLRVLDFNGGMC